MTPHKHAYGNNKDLLTYGIAYSDTTKSLKGWDDARTAEYLQRSFRHHPLLRHVSERITSDRNKLRVMANMLRVVEQLREGGCKVGRRSYAVVMKVVVGQVTTMDRVGISDDGSKMRIAERLYEEMKGRGIQPGGAIYGMMMQGYIRCGNLSKALDTWQEMREEEVAATHVHYAMLIQVCGRLGDEESAWKVLSTMESERIQPTPVVMNALVGACTSYRSAKKAVLRLVQQGVVLDESSARKVVACCLREAGVPTVDAPPTLPPDVRLELQGNVHRAEALFKRLGVEVTSMVQSALIRADVALEEYDRAYQRFKSLRKPCFFAITGVLTACAQACSKKPGVATLWLSRAEAVYHYGLREESGGRSTVLPACMAAVYTAAGEMEKAKQLQKQIEASDVNFTTAALASRNLAAAHSPETDDTEEIAFEEAAE